MKTIALCLVSCALWFAEPALAQKNKVYRCTEGGRTVYADSPCKQSAAVDAGDARSDAQRKTAREIVERDQKLNDKMARDRQAAEAAAASQRAAVIPYSDAASAAAVDAKGDKAKAARPRKKSATKA
jgi:hypothetical protein